MTWEMVETVKSKPKDFVVGEIGGVAPPSSWRQRLEATTAGKGGSGADGRPPPMPPPEPRVADLMDPETLYPPLPDSDTMAPVTERGGEDGGDEVVEGKDESDVNVAGGIPGGGDSLDLPAKRPRTDDGTGTDDDGYADGGTDGGPAWLAMGESDGEDEGG